jgi:hypothetical protein
VAVKEVDDGTWIVTFMHYELGYIDWSRRRFNPSTTRSARGCYPCLGATCYLCLEVGPRLCWRPQGDWTLFPP